MNQNIEYHKTLYQSDLNWDDINKITRLLLNPIKEIEDFKLNFLWIIHKVLKWVIDKNYENISFRSVPWVMDQAILYKDEQSEIRIHSFLENSSDTYIHNHKNPFASFCLEWGYNENLWSLWEDEGSNLYQFMREIWGDIKFDKKIENKKLILQKIRNHYKWNILISPSNLFHSITWSDWWIPPLTFILKHLRPHWDNQKCLIYSESLDIQNPTTPIRESLDYEIQRIKGRIIQSLNSL